MTGRLVSAAGAFGFSVTFFRFVRTPALVVYSASLSVIDETTQTLYQRRLTDRGTIPGDAAAATGPRDVTVGRWRFRQAGSPQAPFFAVTAGGGTLALDITGAPRKPRALLGASASAADSRSSDEAYTNVAVDGTVALGGKPLAVHGTAWLDHDASDDDFAREAPLVQVRVQLDDGREVYVEQRRTQRRGYLIQRNGAVEALRNGDFYFVNHLATTWRSTHTGTPYPDLWALGVAGKTQRLALEPVAFDQESLGHGAGRTFWDGACDVYDVTPDSQGARLGSAYVLLTGFRAPDAPP